jgi:hypothetical protein
MKANGEKSLYRLWLHHGKKMDTAGIDVILLVILLQM